MKIKSNGRSFEKASTYSKTRTYLLIGLTRKTLDFGEYWLWLIMASKPSLGSKIEKSLTDWEKQHGKKNVGCEFETPDETLSDPTTYKDDSYIPQNSSTEVAMGRATREEVDKRHQDANGKTPVPVATGQEYMERWRRGLSPAVEWYRLRKNKRKNRENIEESS